MTCLKINLQQETEQKNDQDDSLIDLSLVSKQLHDIICIEPGKNNNRIIPVFEINGNLPDVFFQNLHDHFLNKKTTDKLQGYQIMIYNDVDKLVSDEYNCHI
jgi:hypothetical protein